MTLRSILFHMTFSVAMALTGAIARAGENCTCRGNDQDIPEGQTVCLKTASGMKLARCERVLNNTSWKMLESDCPVAGLQLQSDWMPDRG